MNEYQNKIQRLVNENIKLKQYIKANEIPYIRKKSKVSDIDYIVSEWQKVVQELQSRVLKLEKEIAQAKQEGRKEALKEIFDEALKEGYYHLAELKELKKEYQELKEGKDE